MKKILLFVILFLSVMGNHLNAQVLDGFESSGDSGHF